MPDAWSGDTRYGTPVAESTLQSGLEMDLMDWDV